MTIASIVSEVQTITGKHGNTHLPLLKDAIRRAILSCHAAAHFERDLVEYNFASFAVDTSTYKYTDSLPVRFREEHPKEPLIAFYTDGSKFKAFTKSTEEVLLDYFQFKTPNTYMIIGNQIIINYPGQPSAIHLKYFGFPAIDMGAETTDSWIVSDYDIPVVHKSAYNVFAASGDQEGRGWQGELYTEAKDELLRNFPSL